MVRVALRVDATETIGTGHLKRCLALAESLHEAGAELTFVVRRIDAVATALLSGKPWAVLWLPAADGSSPFQSKPDDPPHAAWAKVGSEQDALETIQGLARNPPEWVVVDHYAFDARWHSAVAVGLSSRLLVIDDTADREIDADVLLDQNWAGDYRAKFAGRLKREPRWLCGPHYALLSGFYRDAPRYRARTTVQSIGIFMGGTDPAGISARVLVACRQAGFLGEIEVASTSSSPHLAVLRAACSSSPPASVVLDAPDLVAFFARHDLQIGAGGGATWERCRVGAPTIVLAVADNQVGGIQALAGLGAVRAASLPGACLPGAEPLVSVLSGFLSDAETRLQIADCAAALVDGRGAQRVALRMLGHSLQVRPAELGDSARLHGWRNHPAVRAVSIHGDAIAWSGHVTWLERVLASSDRWLFVGEVGRMPVGSIRFDCLSPTVFEVSLYLDPELSGLGLGPCLLLAGERAMARLLGRAFTVSATVMQGNAASKRLFETCGYHERSPHYFKTIDSSQDCFHEDS